MSAENSTPKAMWIITEEVSQTNSGAKSSEDIGGRLNFRGNEGKKDEMVITRRQVEVTKLKEEMKGFLQAMQEMLDQTDLQDSQIQLDEVELSVEVNGEGQISLFGVGGGKVGGKGAMTFKFKRK
jgi:hypothetical protein